MPIANRLQFAFLVSFLLVFSALYLISNFVGGKLRDAGYDISELILIGLPSKDGSSSNTTNIWKNGMGQVDGPAAEFLTKFWQNGFPNVLALVFAAVSSVLIFMKVAYGQRKPVLNPAKWQEFPLAKKVIVSPNTALYRFALPHPQDVLGLPIGQHISVQATIAGKDIMRSYTPTSSDDELGYFDLLIKSYERGNVSRYFSQLKIGDHVRIKGPKGQFRYHPTLSRELGMIAGGTGITPMLQIIRAALKSPTDPTKISLIYANVNEDDILLRTELDDLVAKNSGRFKVYYVLNNPPSGWIGGVGFVSKEQIQEHLPKSSRDIKILLCGPPPMMAAMKKHLDELKYPSPRTVSKLADEVFLF